MDSKLDDVKRITASVKAPYPVVQGPAAIVNAFGALAAVPKVLVFDRTGKLASVIHGAPPDGHERLNRAIATTIGRAPQDSRAGRSPRRAPGR